MRLYSIDAGTVKTDVALCGSEYKGVQVTTASFRDGAADSMCQELAPRNPGKAGLAYSGLPSALCPSVSLPWEDERKVEAGERKPKNICILPAGGSETARAGTPIAGCTFQTYSCVSSFRYGLRDCFSANNNL